MHPGLDWYRGVEGRRGNQLNTGAYVVDMKATGIEGFASFARDRVAMIGLMTLAKISESDMPFVSMFEWMATDRMEFVVKRCEANKYMAEDSTPGFVPKTPTTRSISTKYALETFSVGVDATMEQTREDNTVGNSESLIAMRVAIAVRALVERVETGVRRDVRRSARSYAETCAQLHAASDAMASDVDCQNVQLAAEAQTAMMCLSSPDPVASFGGLARTAFYRKGYKDQDITLLMPIKAMALATARLGSIVLKDVMTDMPTEIVSHYPAQSLQPYPVSNLLKLTGLQTKTREHQFSQLNIRVRTYDELDTSQTQPNLERDRVFGQFFRMLSAPTSTTVCSTSRDIRVAVTTSSMPATVELIDAYSNCGIWDPSVGAVVVKAAPAVVRRGLADGVPGGIHVNDCHLLPLTAETTTIVRLVVDRLVELTKASAGLEEKFAKARGILCPSNPQLRMEQLFLPEGGVWPHVRGGYVDHSLEFWLALLFCVSSTDAVTVRSQIQAGFLPIFDFCVYRLGITMKTSAVVAVSGVGYLGKLAHRPTAVSEARHPLQDYTYHKVEMTTGAIITDPERVMLFEDAMGSLKTAVNADNWQDLPAVVLNTFGRNGTVMTARCIGIHGGQLSKLKLDTLDVDEPPRNGSDTILRRLQQLEWSIFGRELKSSRTNGMAGAVTALPFYFTQGYHETFKSVNGVATLHEVCKDTLLGMNGEPGKLDQIMHG